MPERLLILGGTSEARRLSLAVHECFGTDIEQIVSYAGLTGHQPDLPAELHVGGFGGATGLRDFIQKEGITFVVDATHPFAAQISSHALQAVKGLEIEACTLMRPPWQQEPDDDWIMAGDITEAVDLLKARVGPVLLSVGSKDVGMFEKSRDQPIYVRQLEEPSAKKRVNGWTYLPMRPPFDLESEKRLLLDRNIQTLVSKNSGGPETYAKIAAAKACQVTVLMIERPRYAHFQTLSSVEAVIEWMKAKR